MIVDESQSMASAAQNHACFSLEANRANALAHLRPRRRLGSQQPQRAGLVVDLEHQIVEDVPAVRFGLSSRDLTVAISIEG